MKTYWKISPLLALIAILISMSLACTLPGQEKAEETPAIMETLVSLSLTQTAVAAQMEEAEQIPSPTPEPEITNTPEATAIPDGKRVIEYDGVYFIYDQSLASSVDGSIEEAMIVEEPAPVTSYPENTLFSFINYPNPEPPSFHTPAIHIYPAQEWKAMNESVNERITRMETDVLVNRPMDLDSYPFLPVWPAAQMFHSNVRYLDFQGGSGVRFLTMYGQATYPIANDNIFYTFQGMTADGQWYISAVLPVRHPNLPNTGEELEGYSMDWEPMYDAAAWEAYRDEVVGMLNSQEDDSFAPSLRLLDEIFESLQITR